MFGTQPRVTLNRSLTSPLSAARESHSYRVTSFWSLTSPLPASRGSYSYYTPFIQHHNKMPLHSTTLSFSTCLIDTISRATPTWSLTRPPPMAQGSLSHYTTSRMHTTTSTHQSHLMILRILVSTSYIRLQIMRAMAAHDLQTYITRANENT